MNSLELSPIAAPGLAANLKHAPSPSVTPPGSPQPDSPPAPHLPALQLDEQRLAWLAMALAPGLGPKRILDAVQQIGTASRIFTMPLTALEGLRFPAEAAQFLFDGKGRRAAEEEWARVVAQGATLVSYACRE